MKPPYDNNFDNLVAWVCSDANPPATVKDSDLVEGHNGHRFSRCNDNSIWYENQGLNVSLTTAKQLLEV